MPNEKPTKEEIKKIMDKAKVASEKKEPAKEKPEPEAKKEPPIEKKQSPAVSPEKEKPKAEVPPGDPEKVALRESVKMLGERMGKLEQTLGQFIAHATAGNPSQETSQGQEPKGAVQEELTPEEELAMLRDAQRKGQPGEGGTPAPPSNTMQMWLIGKVLDSVGKVLPAAMAKGGGGEGTSFSKLAEEIVLAQLKRQMIGQPTGGGDSRISLDVLNTLSKFQGNLLGSFFSAIGKLPKEMGETIVKSAIEGRGGIGETPSGTKEAIE